jgi:putative transposase
VLTKAVLETAREAEISEHVGYDKHDPSGRKHGNRTPRVPLLGVAKGQLAVPRVVNDAAPHTSLGSSTP